MKISIIVPVLDEKNSIKPLHASIAEVVAGLDHDHEVVFINDGSTDGSGEVLDELAASDACVRVVHLRRNYGQSAALMAGIQESRGDVLIPMDGDQQNDPVDLPRLLAKLDEGFDVVSGWRKDRQDNLFTRRLPSRIANWLISRLLGVHLHDYGCTLKAYRREVLENVKIYGEMHRFIPAYAAWEGARVTEITVAHHRRRQGRSKYGLGRIFRVLLDILLMYFLDRALDRPIQFFGKIGGFALVASFLVFLWMLALKVFEGVSFILTPLPLLAAIFGLSGILFILLGVIAEIQTRTYFEASGKMPYSVRSVRNPLPDKAPPASDNKV